MRQLSAGRADELTGSTSFPSTRIVGEPGKRSSSASACVKTSRTSNLGVEAALGEDVVEELPGLRVRGTAVPEQELDLHSCTVATSGLAPRGHAPERPGTSACAIAAARYQRGTKISARSRSIARDDASATCSGPTTTRLNRPRSSQSCGKPSVWTNPGLTVCTWIAARPELPRDGAGEGELRVLRGRVGPDRDRSCDGDDVHEVRRRRGFERGQERLEAPDRARGS